MLFANGAPNLLDEFGKLFDSRSYVLRGICLLFHRPSNLFGQLSHVHRPFAELD
jgi:hypothetical protein